MQRIFSYQKAVSTVLIFALIVGYVSLTDIHPYLPPFFGLAFLFFLAMEERHNKFLYIPLMIYLLFFETGKGFLPLSGIIFFLLSATFIVPRLQMAINCQRCLSVLYILYAYLGFYLFSLIVATLLSIDPPTFSYLLLYYALIESLLFLVLL